MQAGTQRGFVPLKFQIDAGASRFTVQAFATGLLSAFGHNPRIGLLDYDGEIQFVPQSYEMASVRLTVRTSAMDVLDEMKSDDRKKLEQLMYADVLDAERYPVAAFESKQIGIQKLTDDLLVAQVSGELSFHGTTRSLQFDARVTRLGSSLRISGEFPLRLSEYGVKLVSFAAGALRLKDEVKFNFEQVARMQEESATNG